MELKEIILIFRRDFRFFGLTAGMIFVFGLLAFLLWPIDYRTVISINITREGRQDTSDYKYDSFYRLQADERFADTVVRWLESPRIAADILNGAGIETVVLAQRELSGYFKAERLSSQLVEVEFRTADTSTSQRIADSLEKVLNSQSSKLDAQQSEDSWFRVIRDDPVTRLAKPDWPRVTAGLTFVSIFIAFWTTLIRHYAGILAYEDRN